PRQLRVARGGNGVDQRRRGLPSLQRKEGKSPPRRGWHATTPRAGASQVRVLDAHAQAPARAFADRFLAQVSRGGRRPGVLRASVFRLTSEFPPRGDQPRAIERLTELVSSGQLHTVLRGVTGSGQA